MEERVDMRAESCPQEPPAKYGGCLVHQLAALEQRLTSLQGVPQQLNAITESLAYMSTRLQEMAPATTARDLRAREVSHRAHALQAVSAGNSSRSPQQGRPLVRSANRSNTGTSCSSSVRTMFSGVPLVGEPVLGQALSVDGHRLGEERFLQDGFAPRSQHVQADRVGNASSGSPALAQRWPGDASIAFGPLQPQATLQRRTSTCSDGAALSPKGHCLVQLTRRPSDPISARGPHHLSQLAKVGTAGHTLKKRPSTRSSQSSRRSVSLQFDVPVPNSVPLSPRGDAECDERESLGESSEDASACIIEEPDRPSHPEKRQRQEQGFVNEGRECEKCKKGDRSAAGRDSGDASISLGEMWESRAADARTSTGTISSFIEISSPTVKPNRCMISPGARVRVAWECLMSVVAVVVGLLVPLAFVYLDGDALWRAPCGPLLNVASAAWLLDVVLSFRTSIEERGRPVVAPGQVALRYVKSWLAPDLLTAVPHSLAPAGSAASQAICALKLLRLARLLQKERQILGLGGRLAVAVLLLVHLCAALWRTALSADGCDRLAERAGEYSPRQWPELYVEDAYWVMMTMTTVGFGDVSACGPRSQLFSILAMLIAPLFFGTIVSLLTHLTKQFFNDEVEAQVAEAARFAKHRGIPAELQKRVEHNLRYQISIERNFMPPSLFARLSPAIQRELSLELLRSTVLQFPLFRDVQHSFIAELAQAHTRVACLPGDLVVDEGQLMQEVVFVIRGRLLMRCSQPGEGHVLDAGRSQEELPQQDSVHEVDVVTGAWFGEACLFFDDRVRTAAAAAMAESELAVLPANAYHQVVSKFPRLLSRHRCIERALREGSVALRELAHKPLKSQASSNTWIGCLCPTLLEQGQSLRRRSGRLSEFLCRG